MSWNVRWVINAQQKARKAGNSSEFARLSKLLEDAQARCKERGHPGPTGSRRFTQKDYDSLSPKNKDRYAVGGTLKWCMLCGDKTGYDPPEAT